jgi:hypothetical protein
MASEAKIKKATADLHKAVQTNDVRVVDAFIDRLKRDGLLEERGKNSSCMIFKIAKLVFSLEESSSEDIPINLKAASF